MGMGNVTLGGFRVWGTVSGGEGAIPRTFIQELASGYSTQISKGDIIIPVSDGTVAQSANNSTTILGVVTGCSYVLSGAPWGGRRQPSDFVPASTTFSPSTVGSPNASLVQYVPLTGDIILEVDADENTTFSTAATALGAIGENCALTTSGSVSTVIGVSVMCLDISTHVTTAQQFRIVGVRGYSMENGFDASLNDPTASRFKYLVMCNQGVLPPYTTSGV